MWRASAKHAPQAPRVGAHDVILTGLDEESDSTNEEMPPLEPLEPLEGAAQLGEVWPVSYTHLTLPTKRIV